LKKKVIGGLVSTLMLSSLIACGGNETASNSNSTPSENKSEGTSEVQGKKIIKAGIGLNEQHPQYKGMEKFKQIVEEKTNGAIEVEIYHTAQLGDDRQMIEGLQLGSLEVTVPATAPLANFVKDFNILNFPFLFPNAKVADAVLDGEPGGELLKKLEAAQMVGLSYWEEGFYNISNNVRPINSAADLQGIKIRTMENQMLLDVFKELGANPTPMAFPEVYTSLQQGVVDAQTNPPSQIYEAKFHEVQKYVSSTNDLYGVWVFLMNKDFYDGLTPEQQQIVKEASEEARDFQRKLSRDLEEEYVEKLKKAGIEYNDVSDEAKAEMREIIKPVLDKYSNDIDPSIMENFYNAINAAQ